MNGFTKILMLAAVLMAAPNAAMAAATAAPEGSYQKSCKDIHVSEDGATLAASCKQRDGVWRATTLAGIKECTDAPANMNGQLHCNKGGVPPSGSYSATCREIWLEAGTLHASCDDGHGHSVANELQDVSSCSDRVGNVHGHLACAKGAKAPAGSYRTSCWDIVVAGNSLQARCEGPGGTPAATRLDDIRGCTAITNHNGTLVCVKPK